MNHSVSYAKGTLRGMHFQHPPFREIKLVRCIAGTVMDVIVDIRQGSPTFLQWQAVELSAENNRMIYIPEGFAHGFQTLQDNSALIYHHTEFYTPGAEGGIRYDDPLVAKDKAAFDVRAERMMAAGGKLEGRVVRAEDPWGNVVELSAV